MSVIYVTEVLTNKGNFTTNLELPEVKDLRAAAELTEDKLLPLPLEGASTEYKGELMKNQMTTYIDLNVVEIYGYTSHCMENITNGELLGMEAEEVL